MKGGVSFVGYIGRREEEGIDCLWDGTREISCVKGLLTDQCRFVDCGVILRKNDWVFD